MTPCIKHVIWHITDIHQESGKHPQIDARQDLPRIPAPTVTHVDEWESAAKRIDVKKLRDRGLAPDWIACSGDFGTAGSRPDLDRGVKLLEALSDRLGLERHRIVVAPGNHDVKRGVGLISYKEAIAKTGFSNTLDPFPITQATDGLLIIPVDTTELTARNLVDDLDADRLAEALGLGFRSKKARASKLLQALSVAFGNQLWHRAGFVSAESIKLISDLGDALRGAVEERSFPVLVCHHPVLSPAGRKADADAQDTVVLAPLLKRRLLDAGVQLVLQGHRHEPSAHQERVLDDPETHGSIIAVTSSSLASGDAFSCIEIVRSDDGLVRAVLGRRVTRAMLQPSANGRSKIWFDTILLAKQIEPSCSIRKVLRIDTKGLSRVDCHFNGIPAELAQRGFGVTLNTFGGLIDGKVRVYPTGYRGGGVSPEIKSSGELRSTGANFRLSSDGVKENVSIVVRAEAQGAHALFKEEAALLRGIAINGWQREVTDFYCDLPTRLLDIVVRFPLQSSVPLANTIWLEAFRPDSGVNPIHRWDDHIKGLTCIEASTICVWPEGRRVFAQIPFPIPGLAYCLSWELPSAEPWSGDRNAATLLAGTLSKARISPKIIPWSELSSSVTSHHPTEVIHNSIYVLGKTLLKEWPDLAALVESGHLELSLMLADRAYGDGGACASTVGVVSAIGPEGCGEWSRWHRSFKYGTGLAGLVLRHGDMSKYDAQEAGPDSLVTRMYIPLDDSGKRHSFLVCLPGVPVEGFRPIAVISIGVLEGGKVPSQLQDRDKLSELGSTLWSKLGSFWASCGLDLKLELFKGVLR